MKKRAAEMKGKFEIKSEPGMGSVMKFELPLDGTVLGAQASVPALVNGAESESRS